MNSTDHEFAWEKKLREEVNERFKDITIEKIEKIPYIYCSVCSTNNNHYPPKLNKINDSIIICDFCLSKLEKKEAIDYINEEERRIKMEKINKEWIEKHKKYDINALKEEEKTLLKKWEEIGKKIDALHEERQLLNSRLSDVERLIKISEQIKELGL